MLQSIDYEDMGVVEEFASGSTLVGEAEATNLWPKRFSPATMTISELRDNACKERQTEPSLPGECILRRGTLAVSVGPNTTRR